MRNGNNHKCNGKNEEYYVTLHYNSLKILIEMIFQKNHKLSKLTAPTPPPKKGLTRWVRC